MRRRRVPDFASSSPPAWPAASSLSPATTCSYQQHSDRKSPGRRLWDGCSKRAAATRASKLRSPEVVVCLADGSSNTGATVWQSGLTYVFAPSNVVGRIDDSVVVVVTRDSD